MTGTRQRAHQVEPMEKFTKLEGVAAPLNMINVDTDAIIPKQYLKTIKRTGLGSGLFSEKRYKDDGSENPDFVLNKPAYRRAKILVAGDNFGCGSAETVTRAFEGYWRDMRFGNLLVMCQFGTLPAELTRANMERFARGVMPRLKALE